MRSSRRRASEPVSDGTDPRPDALALLDTAACGLMQTADDGTFLRVNRTFCHWLGYGPEDLVGQRRFQDLLTIGGRIFHQTHWAPLLRMQGSVSEVKLDVLHREGESIPMVFNSCRYEHDGVVVHDIAAFVARDRDRYEQELVRARKRLEDLVAEANQLHADAKDRATFAEQMIGIVSHDLRNPLSTIVMGAALLGRGELTAAQQRVVQQISRATNRANWLISDLLDFTKARMGGGLSVTPVRIDLHETIADALEGLRLAHPERTLVHVREGAAQAMADANRLVQLVGNLVANAVAYGAPDAPIVVTSSTNATSVAVTVHNVGPEIPEDVQAGLFQPMTRGTSVGGKARSVGLGLFIVREIAKAHRGDAFVHSTTKDGTTFGVAFPGVPDPE